MSRILIVVTLSLGLAACATPGNDFDRRYQSLHQRGVSTAQLDAEMHAQQDKFALFRSYRYADQLLQALEEGTTPPPRPVGNNLAASYTCVTTYTDTPNRVVCYIDTCSHGISCVRLP